MSTRTPRNLVAFYLLLGALGVLSAIAVLSYGSMPLLAQANRFGAMPTRASALSTTVKVLNIGTVVIDSIDCQNPNASAAYLQLFNTGAAVTLGTTVPDWAVSFPSSGHVTLTNLNLNFGKGLAIAATTTATGNSALGSALDCNLGTR